jgi:hypothetical protein
MLVELCEIIKTASNPPQKQDLARLKAYLKAHPGVVNQTDDSNKTPCHYAIHNIPLLEILALEGNATIPENLTEDPIVLNKIKKLKKEQLRPQIGFHLHDYLRNQTLKKVVLDRLIKNQCVYHRSEINELSYYWRRNACHWAALMGRHEYLEMLVKEGGNLSEKDINGKTPLDLAADDTTRAVIEKLLKSPPVILKTPEQIEGEQQQEKDENFVDRIKIDIEGLSLRMMRAMSPTRKPKVEAQSRRPQSPPRNPKYYERHHRALSANLSPRDQSKSDEKHKRATSPTHVFVLRRISSADAVEKETINPTRSTRSQSLSGDFIAKEDVARPRTNTIAEPERVRRAVRFIQNYSPIMLEPILEENSGSPEAPSSPVRTEQQDKISVANLLAIFKNKRLTEFKSFYELNKIGPNQKLSALWGRPCIIQAVLDGASNIFVFLVGEGASLEAKTEKGKSISDCILENNPLERIEFLKRMRTVLVNKINLKNLPAKRAQLARAEIQLVRQLEIHGLLGPLKYIITELDENRCKEIAEKHKQEEKLVKTLYNLSLGLRLSDQDTFNLEKVKNITVGLLIHDSRVLVKLLSDLYPHLHRQQKVAVIFIVKEIILKDKFNACYRNKHFFEQIFPKFCKLLEEDDFNIMAKGLHTLVDLQFQLDHRYVRAINALDNILLQCDMTLPEPEENDPKMFADALRAITAQFWRTFKITELVNKAWEEEIESNVRNQFGLFNKISQYLVIDLLKQTGEKEQRSKIEFYAKTIHELVHGDPCDLQSAKALSTGFDSRFLNKQVQSFIDSNSELAKQYLIDQEILGLKNNSEGQRKLVDNREKLVFPWLGLLTKPLVLSYEGNKEIQPRAEIDGGIYAYILWLQDRIKRECAATSPTRLGYHLHISKELTDDSLEILSMVTNPRPINLTTKDLAILSDLIAICLEHQLPLKVYYKEEFEALTPIQVIFAWLKDYIASEGIRCIDDLNKLLHKMEFFPGARDTVRTERAEIMNWLKIETTTNPKLSNLKIYFDKDSKNKERQEDEDDVPRFQPN